MKKLLLAALFGLVSTTVHADMVLVGVYSGNDPAEDTTILQGLIGSDPLIHLGRVDWDFSDADGNPDNGIQAINPQSSGDLTIEGVVFNEAPDSTEAIAGTWSWNDTFDTLDYLTFKFDSWLAVYQITGGMTSGSWDLAALCTTNADWCNSNGEPFALSHSAGYSVVPVPAAVWLFGSGLLGLVGIARRKAHA